MLDLNITRSNFEAEIIILSSATEVEMKNGIAYKKQNVYCIAKINKD